MTGDDPIALRDGVYAAYRDASPRQVLFLLESVLDPTNGVPLDFLEKLLSAARDRFGWKPLATWAAASEATLGEAFSFLDSDSYLFILPLVCKRWRRLTQSGTGLRTVQSTNSSLTSLKTTQHNLPKWRHVQSISFGKFLTNHTRAPCALVGLNPNQLRHLQFSFAGSFDGPWSTFYLDLARFTRLTSISIDPGDAFIPPLLMGSIQKLPLESFVVTGTSIESNSEVSELIWILYNLPFLTSLSLSACHFTRRTCVSVVGGGSQTDMVDMPEMPSIRTVVLGPRLLHPTDFTVAEGLAHLFHRAKNLTSLSFTASGLTLPAFVDAVIGRPFSAGSFANLTSLDFRPMCLECESEMRLASMLSTLAPACPLLKRLAIFTSPWMEDEGRRGDDVIGRLARVRQYTVCLNITPLIRFLRLFSLRIILRLYPTNLGSTLH